MEDFSYINGPGTPLKRAQDIMVDILSEFDRICRKNNLVYWIDYGTLLGAIRHEGFIPWDDDIDVSMPSKDFERFKEIASSEVSPGFFVQYAGNDHNYDMGKGLIKMRKDNTLFINDFDVFRSDYHKGISIDIFEVIKYPTVSARTWNFYRKNLFKTKSFFHYNKPLTFGNIIRYFVFPPLYILLKMLWGLTCLLHKHSPERTLSRIERTPYGYPTLLSEIYPLQEISFCSKKFFAPKNPAARMEDNFGKDYMTIPPADKRRIHAKFICSDNGDSYVNL